MDCHVTTCSDKLPLALIVHHTTSLTPDDICQSFTQLLSAGLLLIRLPLSVTFISVSGCAQVVLLLTCLSFFLYFLSFSFQFFCLCLLPLNISFVLSSFSPFPRARSVMVRVPTSACPWAPILPSLNLFWCYFYVVALPLRSLSLSLSLLSSCLYTDTPNQLSPLFFLCPFPPSVLLLLLTSGCSAGKLSYSSFFSPLLPPVSCLHGWIDTVLFALYSNSTSAVLIICRRTSGLVHHQIKLPTCLAWCQLTDFTCHACPCAFCSLCMLLLKSASIWLIKLRLFWYHYASVHMTFLSSLYSWCLFCAQLDSVIHSY